MRSASLRRFGLALSLLGAAWWSTPTEAVAASAWVAPLPEPLTITRAFDPPENPYGAGHRGVDLAADPGEQVRAAGAGAVVYAGPLAGRGVISIQHADGLRTTYEPVLASVAAGVAVSLGQVIGTLQAGHAGCPAAACLHWGLKRGEVYLDPLILLSRGPVRLLPRYGAQTAGSAVDPASAMTVGTLTIGTLGLLPLARRRMSGSRMRPAVDRLESLGTDMGIDLRRGQARVAK